MGFYEFSSPYDWSRIAEYKRTAASAPGGMIDLSVGSPVDSVPLAVRGALTAAALTWGRSTPVSCRRSAPRRRWR